MRRSVQFPSASFFRGITVAAAKGSFTPGGSLRGAISLAASRSSTYAFSRSVSYCEYRRLGDQITLSSVKSTSNSTPSMAVSLRS